MATAMYGDVIHHSPATPAILLLCFSFHSCVTISRVFSPFFISRCSSIFHAGSFQLFYRPFACARRPHTSASADPIWSCGLATGVAPRFVKKNSRTGSSVSRRLPLTRFCTYVLQLTSLLSPPLRVGGIKRWCASDVCLASVAYIGPKSRTERRRKTKTGTEVGHVTRDSDTTFKVKRSKVKVRGGAHYRPYSLFSLALIHCATILTKS